MFMLAWLAGGILSIIGALCYAELASTYPGAGGDYSYLRRALGERTGFIYAWARLSVIQTGSLALLAFVFGDYFAQVIPIGATGSTIYAAAVVVVLTAVNWVGVRQGAGTQFWLTALEVGGLLLIIVVGLLLAAPAPVAAAPAAPADPSQRGLVMVFVLLTFGGWSEAVYVTAELRNASRKIASVLVLSLAFVTLLYLLVNAAFLRVLGLEAIAASETVATDLMRVPFGDAGAIVISLAVAIAALTSANATIFTGARTAYALGRSVPRLRWLGRWDGGRETPGNALIAQGLVALVLVVLGGFSRDGFQYALEFTAPVFWLFMLCVGLGLFILRVREPDVERPFKVPLYPVLPVIFCATSAYLLYSSIAYTGLSALAGVALLILGALLSFLIRVPPTTRKQQEELSK
jgi:basic amino acid/polyamine antiporter, APA family